MDKIIRVLLVEDSISDARLTKLYLEKATTGGPFSFTHFTNLDDAIHECSQRFDVVLLDLGLPDSEGPKGVARLRTVSEAPIIVLSGSRDEALALDAVREGAQDYLMKDDLDSRHLARAISYAIERHAMSEALAAAKEKAEIASKAKSDFLAVMSHEFRTPMNGLLGCLNLISDHEIPTELEELLEMVESCARGQLTLIDDILDLSQIESGKADIVCEESSLKEIIVSVVEAMRLAANSKGIDLSFHIAPDVNDTVETDGRRVRQILFNLIGNALKFTDSGKIAVKVELADAEYLRFEVTDTGIGVPADKQRCIFDEFTQVDSSRNRRFSGTGLGLAICKQLVYFLGGEISVQSEEGQGSTFTFTIRSRSSPAKSTATESTLIDSSPRGFSELYPLAILVVDDSPAFRTLIEKSFLDLGYRVDLASTGAVAIEMSHSKRYDLVLTDLNLPGLDGFEASREIKSLYERKGHTTRIVALTVFETPEMKKRCLDAGMMDLLSKPCSKADFEKVIVDFFLVPCGR